MAADGLARQRFRAATLMLLLTMSLAACGKGEASQPKKIALLAPFEGQYREIGYNALYALRLAFADVAPSNAQLLAVDDGGTSASAIARIRALNLDPAVAAVIAIGPQATHPAAQLANDKPLILVGNWGHDRADEDSFYASDRDLSKSRGSGDLDMLAQTYALADDPAKLRFYSSGSLPDEAFRQRYLNSALYAPAPNPLATLTYDIGRLALSAIINGTAISATEHHGLTGRIRFEAGYWADAPRNRFRYEGDRLIIDTG